MNLQDTLEKINKGRERAEFNFVFSLWNNPELYMDYMTLNEKGDKTLRNKDAIFYFVVGKELYQRGYRSFDQITIDTFLENHPKIRKKFDERGGFDELQNIMSIVAPENVEANFDQINKMNSLSMIAEKYEEMFDDIERFDNATNEDVYNAFDLLNSAAALATGDDARIQDLVIDDAFIEECNSGSEKGLDYGKTCPIMNYITLGIPLGEMTMFAGHSGVGKTSFVFENILMPMSENGIKVAIISNEMRIKDYKVLYAEHIMTHDIGDHGYWGLTRKKMKSGGFSDDELEAFYDARDISQSDKYTRIKFIKLFSNEASQTMKYMRKLALQGFQVVCWDTMKSDDIVDTEMWQQLTVNARKIFQIASKYNIAIVPTYQLALATQNQRYLDASCLSNSKQIKEVFSEMIYIRPLWRNEYSGEKYDCKPYTLHKDENGKWIKDETKIQLDPSKSYVVAFIDKTRNDEDKQQILYEFNGRYNRWREVGRCTIINDIKG